MPFVSQDLTLSKSDPGGNVDVWTYVTEDSVAANAGVFSGNYFNNAAARFRGSNNPVILIRRNNNAGVAQGYAAAAVNVTTAGVVSLVRQA